MLSRGTRALLEALLCRILKGSRGATPDVLELRAAIRSFRRWCKLLLIELLVQSTLSQQFVMCSPFDDASPVHDQDHIRGQDRAQPVRDRERRSIAHQRI